jgi:hypothetical protein
MHITNRVELVEAILHLRIQTLSLPTQYVRLISYHLLEEDIKLSEHLLHTLYQLALLYYLSLLLVYHRHQ